jgi:acetylornithine deacetylase
MDDTPLELLKSLLRISSVNPSLEPGAAGERRIAEFIGAWLEQRGFDVTYLEPEPGRVSVVGVAKGTGGGRSLMFNGHIDTVSLQPFNGDPLEPRIEGHRLYARGAFDMKAGVAAMLIAAARAKSQTLRGDVIVACVADEEHSSLGSFDLVKHFSADAAIVTEPTNHQVCVAHKGFIWGEITTRGVAAHGSRFDLGVDAITKMGAVLRELEELNQTFAARVPHPLLDRASIHASLIEGGIGLSSYPDACRLQFERRTLPGETRQSVELELREILERCAANDPQFEATLELGLERQPFEVSNLEPIVQVLQRVARAELQAEPELYGAAFWADTSALQLAGIPCLMFGAVGEGAHGADEYVDLNSLELTTRVFEQVAKEFCA